MILDKIYIKIADDVARQINANINLQLYDLRKDILKYLTKIETLECKSNIETSISNLNLNNRTKNCLIKEGLDTIEKIISYPMGLNDKKALQEIPNLGEKSYNLLREELLKFGHKIDKWRLS